MTTWPVSWRGREAAAAPLASAAGPRASLATLASTLAAAPAWISVLLGAKDLSRHRALARPRDEFGQSAPLIVWAACLLVVVAFANNASLHGEAWANPGLWLTMAALVAPFATRLAWPGVNKVERVTLLLVLGVALYLVRLLHNPTAFVNHDEFLHWRNVDDILASGRLFSVNPLLPVSPYYPALAGATASIAQVTGLSVFASGALVIGAARVLFLLATFTFFLRLSGHTAVAAMGTLVAMASSNFVFFHGQFAYESLGYALALMCLATAIRVDGAGSRGFAGRLPWLAVPMAAVAMTHHLSSYFVVAVIAGAAVACAVIERRKRRALRLAVMALLGAALCLLWQAIAVKPTTGGYLGPILEHAAGRLYEIISTGSLGRQLFVSESGDVLPVWQRWLALGAVALIGLGLLTGSLRVWYTAGAERNRPWLAMMLLMAWSYPVCVALRLDGATWEIGNRIGTLVFMAVAYVLAHAIVGLWQAGSRSRFRTGVVGAALTVLMLGGMVAGDGPFAQPGPYLVGGENRAVEAEGINAALWTRQRLGEDRIFAADRTNRLLVTVYGRQRPVTTLHDDLDLSSVFLQPSLGSFQYEMIDRSKVEYAVVDERLSTRLPFVGHYYEIHEAPGGHRHPVSLDALNKFDGMRGVDRIYDSGHLAIYDLRGLHGRR